METKRIIFTSTLLTIMGGCYGFIIGNEVGKSSINTNQLERQAQLHNEQLNHQLALDGRQVLHLVLNASDKTFSFDTTSLSGQAEVCTGSYDVRQGDTTATAVGKLACTVDVPLK